MRFDAPMVAILVLCCAVGFGCGPADPPPPAPGEEPTRTAAQDRAIRRLMLEGGETHLCDFLAGRLVALADTSVPDVPGQTPAAGRLWVEECRAERQQDRLAIHLGGRGWTWADETRGGPLGTSFSVRGHLRFDVDVDITGSLDLGYSEERHVVSAWYTPSQSPRAQLTPIGDIPVRSQGSWSGILGTVGSILGSPVEARAGPAVARAAAQQITQRLSGGLTATTELCTGQLDFHIGALADGQTPRRPYPAEGLRWLENQRVRLRPQGIDVAGPWDVGDDGLRIDIESEEGEGFEVRLMCEQSARRVLEAFINGRPASPGQELQRVVVSAGRSQAVELAAANCPVMLVVTPRGEVADYLEYRYRVLQPNVRIEPLVDCD